MLLGLAGGIAGGMAGCATQSTDPSGVPATSPVPAPLPPAPAPLPPATPALPPDPKAAQTAAQTARDLLDMGQEEQARVEIERALALDPANRLAASLKKQIEDDPFVVWGRESFAYMVKPGESLSKIAAIYLRDPLLFYFLARYNDIKVPRQVAGNQTIRLPSKVASPAAPLDPRPPIVGPATAAPAPLGATSAPAPLGATSAPAPLGAASAPTPSAALLPVPAVPPPPPSPAELAMKEGETAERAGQMERALGAYQRAVGLQHPGATLKVERARKRLIDDYTRAAVQATARQDLQGAITQWDRVLRLDPFNETARSERRRAAEGLEKLQGR
jgi:tetratricopeptide (TPR) repeat protein